MNFLKWENIFESKIATVVSSEDPAHDLNHFKRVVIMAKKLCVREGAQLEIVLPAAWLHDLVIVPKNSVLRAKASRMSADKALAFLKEINYPNEFHLDIAHAIEGHSFSANVEVKTLEAKIVQDADRLDGLGAIGIARCFATAGLMKRSFYKAEDPFCEERDPDDQLYTIDHFYQKLFKIAENLITESGRTEGLARVQVMKEYIKTLRNEITYVS